MKQRLHQCFAWLRERPGGHLVLQVLSMLLLVLLVLGFAASAGAFYPHQTLPPFQAGSNGPATQWYFAEGFTGTNFTEYLSWANFTATAATLTVTYYFDTGASPLVKTYALPANTRSGVNVNTEVGSGHSVAIAVSSTQPIVVERPIYFNYSGAGGVPGGSDVVGATTLSTSFHFGYLDTTAQHDSLLMILNPSSSSMTVTAIYTPATGGAATTVTHTVAATSRGTITVNGDGGLAAGMYWAKVTLSTPGLVERVLYEHDTVTGYTGGSAVVGTAPQTDWYFAEGHTSALNSERYVLTNPSTTTVPVTLTFYPTGGSTFANGAASLATQVTLAPGQQELLNVNTLLGTNEVDNSAWVHASQAILAERVMSVASVGPGLTDTVGTPTPCTQYAFAEGFTGSNFYEYLILFNPNSSTASVQVSYVPGGGSATVQTYSVPAHSRVGVFVNSVMPNQSLAMLVQVTSGPSIVAERPMYFNSGGDIGASSVVGAQTC